MKKIFFAMLVLLAGVAISSPVKSNIACRETATTIEASGPTAKDYIHNGLIAMWDGIENAGWGVHDPKASVWKDLSGNENDLTVSNSSVWYDDYLYNASTKIANLEKSLPVVSAACVFFVDSTKSINAFTVNPGTGDSYIYIASASNGSIGLSRNSASEVRGYLGVLNLDIAGTFASIAANWKSNVASTCFFADKAWINGVSHAVERNTAMYNNAAGVVCIGGRIMSTSSIYSGGKVCHLRLYCRALTAVEIAHNYAIDKARFNLP